LKHFAETRFPPEDHNDEREKLLARKSGNA